MVMIRGSNGKSILVKSSANVLVNSIGYLSPNSSKGFVEIDIPPHLESIL